MLSPWKLCEFCTIALSYFLSRMIYSVSGFGNIDLTNRRLRRNCRACHLRADHASSNESVCINEIDLDERNQNQVIIPDRSMEYALDIYPISRMRWGSPIYPDHWTPLASLRWSARTKYIEDSRCSLRTYPTDVLRIRQSIIYKQLAASCQALQRSSGCHAQV